MAYEGKNRRWYNINEDAKYAGLLNNILFSFRHHWPISRLLSNLLSYPILHCNRLNKDLAPLCMLGHCWPNTNTGIGHFKCVCIGKYILKESNRHLVKCFSSSEDHAAPVLGGFSPSLPSPEQLLCFASQSLASCEKLLKSRNLCCHLKLRIKIWLSLHRLSFWFLYIWRFWFRF